jgi:RNA polymerase sigma factor (TIGR02999 family)
MDIAPPPGELTQLLAQHRAGDAQALPRATALAYAELKRLAERHLRRDGRSTLAATDVLHEACLRLLGERVSVADRAHFFALASRIMRNVLVDYARSRQRLKRGAGDAHVTITTGIADQRAPDVDVLALDEALSRLAELDPRKCQVLEMHYFGGLTYDEMAHATGTSPATVDRDLRFAKAWLERELAA